MTEFRSQRLGAGRLLAGALAAALLSAAPLSVAQAGNGPMLDGRPNIYDGSSWSSSDVAAVIHQGHQSNGSVAR